MEENGNITLNNNNIVLEESKTFFCSPTLSNDSMIKINIYNLDEVFTLGMDRSDLYQVLLDYIKEYMNNENFQYLQLIEKSIFSFYVHQVNQNVYGSDIALNINGTFNEELLEETLERELYRLEMIDNTGTTSTIYRPYKENLKLTIIRENIDKQTKSYI